MGLPPLIIALKKFNRDPNIYSVPKKGTYQHDYLMKLVHSESKPKMSKKPKMTKASYTEESEVDRIMRLIREAEESVRR